MATWSDLFNSALSDDGISLTYPGIVFITGEENLEMPVMFPEGICLRNSGMCYWSHTNPQGDPMIISAKIPINALAWRTIPMGKYLLELDLSRVLFETMSMSHLRVVDGITVPFVVTAMQGHPTSFPRAPAKMGEDEITFSVKMPKWVEERESRMGPLGRQARDNLVDAMVLLLKKKDAARPYDPSLGTLTLDDEPHPEKILMSSATGKMSDQGVFYNRPPVYRKKQL